MGEKSYEYYWGEDVIGELRGDPPDKKQVRWVLSWMKKQGLVPEENSVTGTSDIIKKDFETYLLKKYKR